MHCMIIVSHSRYCLQLALQTCSVSLIIYTRGALQCAELKAGDTERS